MGRAARSANNPITPDSGMGALPLVSAPGASAAPPVPCDVTEKGFISFAAGNSRKSRAEPNAAKVMKPCSELNRRLRPDL